MSTPRFTLGPWVATPYGDVMPVGATFLVASCGGKSGMYRDYKANAFLIAAAPTLFGIVRQYMASDERQGFTGTILYEQAKAAIEAATGEKS